MKALDVNEDLDDWKSFGDAQLECRVNKCHRWRNQPDQNVAMRKFLLVLQLDELCNAGSQSAAYAKKIEISVYHFFVI